MSEPRTTDQKLPEAIRQWLEADRRAFRDHMIEQYILAALCTLGTAACLFAMWWLS